MNTLCPKKDAVNKKTQKTQDSQKSLPNASTDDILKHENEALKKALEQLKLDHSVLQ